MARRLKQAVPEFEEVEDDGDEKNIWVAYENANPPMQHLTPLLRTAEAMLDPRKPGSYHLKVAAARKFCRLLGEGWGIENGRITRTLPFGFEMRFKHTNADTNEALIKVIRDWLMVNATAPPMAGIRGIHIAPHDKRPAEAKRGWLYVFIPANTTCRNTQARFNGQQLQPELVMLTNAPQRFPNGIATEGGAYDFALFAPQTIYLKARMASELYGHMIVEAIKGGAQLAMRYDGGERDLDGWLRDGAADHDATRSGLLDVEKKKLAAIEAKIQAAAAQIVAEKEQAETVEATITGLSKKMKGSDLLKKYPALASVESVNRDDPYNIVVTTKDIVVNGVNLGPYSITMRPEQILCVVKAKRLPGGIAHPNLWQEGDKWTWDLSKDQMDALIKALSANKIHEATNVVVTNLLTVPAGGDHEKRLKTLEEAILKEAEKKAAKKAPEPKVADGIEGDPVKV